jgi:hypothetical protein
MKWFFAALVFGILAISLGIASSTAWHSVQTVGSQFLSSQSGRKGFTTFDQTYLMAAAALVCGVACLGSVVAIFSTHGDQQKRSGRAGADEFGSGSWICPSCHESNPGNFDECWKCQRNRPRERAR